MVKKSLGKSTIGKGGKKMSGGSVVSATGTGTGTSSYKQGGSSSWFTLPNITFLLLILVIGYLAYNYFSATSKQNSNPMIILGNLGGGSGNISSLMEPATRPPTNDMYMAPNQLPPARSVRNTYSQTYTQIGILTRVQAKGDDLILPLMGRKIRSDKMQYYTMSSNSALNSKLPVSRNGKSCTGEYGCDEIMNGDTVYVEGYKDTFKATVYESGQFQYTPDL